MVWKVSFFLTICLSLGHTLRPKGVRPDFASFYDPNSAFHCLDGSAEIPFDQVNDDYCDCKDGSDEPGTAACPNAQFYCSNRGFKPSLLTSSRVNDGICDCCDGSDEWAQASGSPCVNNCDEMGAAERIERERLEKVVEEGLRIKAEMAAQGAEARGLRQQEIQTKKVDLETLHADKEAKKVIKDEKERFEKEALDVIREEEDRLRQVKEEQERKDKEAEALSYFAKLDKNGDGYITKDELIFEIVLDQNNDGQVSDEEVNFYMSGHDNYDQETFLNTGWLLMKHLYSKFEKPVDNNEPTEDINTEPNDDVQDYDYDDLDDNEDEDAMKAPEEKIEGIEEDHDQAEQVSGYPPEVQALVDAANAARDEFNAADRAYNDANREIQDLERYLSKDFGPDDTFAPLANQCFEYNDLEYTYKMCAFDYCAQKPLHGGSETRLGSWEKWSVPHTQMSYERGVQCWNGPSRSATVDLRCGAENKLVGTSEPNRCEYLFIFETPAACEPLAPIMHDEL